MHASAAGDAAAASNHLPAASGKGDAPSFAPPSRLQRIWAIMARLALSSGAKVFSLMPLMMPRAET